MTAGSPRATVFVDGANLYNAAKALGLRASQIDPYKVARKLVESRTLVQVRYYIAAIDRSAPQRLYRAHIQLRERLATRADVQICTGHIQRVAEKNPCADDLARYLAGLTMRLPGAIFADLMAIARRHQRVEVHREKGVDVALACDLVDLARRDRFDVGYLISADADFRPAVEIVRAIGKRVIVASPGRAAGLVRVSDAAIRLTPEWFADCVWST